MRRIALVGSVIALVAGGGALSMAGPAAVAAAPRPAASTPYVGGTLNALGVSDVDYLDPNLTYYTAGYLVARTFSRQLYSYPAVGGETTKVEPDLATAMPVIGDGGKTYTITIRTGADWNTTPARQVSAADVVRGVKVTCNPFAPFGGLPDFESLIEGMESFCNGSFQHSGSAAGYANYLEHTALPGVQAISANTVRFTLNHPASYFTDELTLPALSPRPVELDAYMPGSTGEAQHTVSDGPYEVTSYSPTKSIVLDRNPAWSAATDPIRKAYVDHIDITEGLQQASIQSKLTANSPTADVGFDSGPTFPQANGLREQHDPRLVVGPQYSLNPFVVFNTVSPNNRGALKSVDVRRAISDALNRHALLKSFGGIGFGSALTQVLPPGIAGSRSFNDYPTNLVRARHLLAKAGHPKLTLKLLYRPASSINDALANTVRSELKRVGITVKFIGAPETLFYAKYLENPSMAKQGNWDLTFVGWGPDWFGDAADSIIKPLFDGRIQPPISSDFGLYNNAALNRTIDQAEQAATGSASLWAKADHIVISDAAVYPLIDPDNVSFHAAQVHNFVLMPEMDNGDYTNMWLSQGAPS